MKRRRAQQEQLAQLGALALQRVVLRPRVARVRLPRGERVCGAARLADHVEAELLGRLPRALVISADLG